MSASAPSTDSPQPLTLAAVCQLLGLSTLSNPKHNKRSAATARDELESDEIVAGICSAFAPKPHHIAYITDSKQLSNVDCSQLSYLIIPPLLIIPDDVNGRTQLFTHPHPRLAMAKLAAHFEPPRPWHTSTQGADSSTMDATVFCHPSSVVADEVSIGSHSYIGPQVTIEHGVKIGAHTIIQAHAYIGDHVEIGDDCWIHPGAVIGSEGFGLVPSDDPAARVWQRVPHLGTVIIGNRVEIGANTTIDRGAIDNTVIADDVILDNQIQIAHNVRIGRGTAMAGCVGIAGSATIGSGCLVGGGSGIAGHLSIGDNTMVNGMSFVSRDLPSDGHYASGFPVLPTKQWNKLVATLRRLLKKKG